MLIRTALFSDLPQLAPLCCDINQWHVEAYPQLYKHLSVAEAQVFLAQSLENPQHVFIVASDKEQILGYCIAHVREVNETPLVKAHRCMYLAEIMVAPQARGQGVGKALLSDLKKTAQTLGVLQVELDVLGFNDRASRMFKSQGFELLRERLVWPLN